MRPQVISFKCILKNSAGRLISQTYNRDVLTVVQPDQNGMLSGLNRQLQNLKEGEKRSFKVSAEEAYGLYDPSKVILFPRRKLPGPVRKGEMIKIVSPKGILRTYCVLDLHDDFASLDGNHPLAGQDLVFEIEAIAAREATPKEIEESLNEVSSQLLH